MGTWRPQSILAIPKWNPIANESYLFIIFLCVLIILYLPWQEGRSDPLEREHSCPPNWPCLPILGHLAWPRPMARHGTIVEKPHSWLQMSMRLGRWKLRKALWNDANNREGIWRSFTVKWQKWSNAWWVEESRKRRRRPAVGRESARRCFRLPTVRWRGSPLNDIICRKCTHKCR